MKYVMLFEEWNKYYNVKNELPSKGLGIILIDSKEEAEIIVEYLTDLGFENMYRSAEVSKKDPYHKKLIEMNDDVSHLYFNSKDKKWYFISKTSVIMNKVLNKYKFSDIFTPKPKFKGYHASKRLGL